MKLIFFIFLISLTITCSSGNVKAQGMAYDEPADKLSRERFVAF